MNSISSVTPPPLAPSAFRLEQFIKSIIAVNGAIHVVGIHPQGAPLIGETFGTIETSIAYINKINADGYNCHWTVNKLKGAYCKTKAKKTDIDAVTFAHIDIDPDPSNLDESRTELLKRVPELIKKYKPSHVLDSGNGLQVFWRHATPLPIEEGESINKQLIKTFNADVGTHNADRLMRIAFTRNYVTEAKLKKGYSKEPALAKLLHFNSDAAYNPALFNEVVADLSLAPPPIITTQQPVAKCNPAQLHRAFMSKVSGEIKLELFLSYQSVPIKGHSEIFITLLNHMAFYAQGDKNLMLRWLNESEFGKAEWFQKRQARTDNIVMKEIEDAIQSQYKFYDPDYSVKKPGDLSHADLAHELGERYFFSNARYVAGQDYWLIWDGSRWLRDEKLKHLSVIGEYLKDRAKELIQWAKSQDNADKNEVAQ